MKRLPLITLTILACLSLSACVNNSKQAKQDSEASSLKVANSKLKKKARKQSKKKAISNNSSSAVNASSQQNNQQQTQSSNRQQQASKGVNNADDAVARARAKYGDQNGYIHWGYMTDYRTGQPIRNPDGSYFVKGTADDGTMTGTQYSLNVYPDGSITSN